MLPKELYRFRAESSVCGEIGAVMNRVPKDVYRFKDVYEVRSRGQQRGRV
jgi:hypothetical protein